MDLDKLIIRKPTPEDNLEKIAELLYNTDPYIYPYWFETLEKCKKELPPLLLEKKFFFALDNLYITIDSTNNEIIGVVCILDKNVDLSYDYTKLKEKNERYKFTIENYIMSLVDEVKDCYEKFSVKVLLIAIFSVFNNRINNGQLYLRIL